MTLEQWAETAKAALTSIKNNAAFYKDRCSHAESHAWFDAIRKRADEALEKMPKEVENANGLEAK